MEPERQQFYLFKQDDLETSNNDDWLPDEVH